MSRHAGCICDATPILCAARAFSAAATARAGLDPKESSVRAAAAARIADPSGLARNGKRRASRHGRRVAHRLHSNILEDSIVFECRVCLRDQGVVARACRWGNQVTSHEQQQKR